MTPLHSALKTVQQTKKLIHELDRVLPNSSAQNFRERLVVCLEHGGADSELHEKAKRLLEIYETQFGVDDLLGHS